MGKCRRRLVGFLALLFVLVVLATATTAAEEPASPPEENATVLQEMSVSITATPPSGVAPATVQFAAAANGKEPLSYAWDFNGDTVVDSTNQNPSTIFETAGELEITLVVTDADSQQVVKVFPFTVMQYESKINLVSFFPKVLSSKENQVTFLVSNTGKETIKDITAKVIGDGIQHLGATTISRLKPGEDDSITVRLNILRGGTLNAKVKIDEKTFSITFTVAGLGEVSPEELETKLNDLKRQLQEQESIYYEKKAQNFLVTDISESIRSVKSQLQTAQQQLLTNKLEEAAVTLNLVAPTINDITRDLATVRKQKLTVLNWLKENALAITTIIAALGTVSGFIVKASLKAKKLGEDVKEKAKKLGENVKEKMSTRRAGNILPAAIAESVNEEEIVDTVQEKKE